MLPLKPYQVETLAALTRYFQETGRLDDADVAFYRTTKELRGEGVKYHTVPQLPRLPYVCLRIPTGGGKTLIGCHALGIAADALLHQESVTVLWLVPTDAIKDQTLGALRNRAHPYRQFLDSRFSGQVTVLDLQEALSVQREALYGGTTVIVSTLAALRVENTEVRKIYESSGSLQHHFSDLDPRLERVLEKADDGTVLFSLANVLRLRCPVVVMDEAHNARTLLSFDSLSRFGPSCIIELTATPATYHSPEQGAYASNVLWHVSAAELKSASMVKLPIILRTRHIWKEALIEAIQIRAHLERLSVEEQKETGEYIRPIALIQAQPSVKRKPSIAVELVKRTLIDDLHVPEAWIAVETAERHELDGIDLSTSNCPIRFIITIYALKEGWDCPFAYVLCSVAEMTSKTAVEQILGRVMRLPSATSKKRGELNQSYAVATAQGWIETARTLTEALVDSGFEKFEAEAFISTAHQQAFPDRPLFSTWSVSLPEPPDLARLSRETLEKVSYSTLNHTLDITGALSRSEQEELQACLTTPEGRKQLSRVLSDLEREDNQLDTIGKRPEFRIPLITTIRGGRSVVLESSLVSPNEWDLEKCDPFLSEEEFPATRGSGSIGEIDVSAKGRVEVRYIGSIQDQLDLLSGEQEWSREMLADWLDRRLAHPDLSRADTIPFIGRLIDSLIDRRHMSLEHLSRERYRLRDALQSRLDRLRRGVRAALYGKMITSNSLGADEDLAFLYPEVYPANWYYTGPYQFRKHYYPLIGELKEDGEETDCAKLLDTLSGVLFWTRNLEGRSAHSFWLPTATDRFYPDFVARLEDGRTLVVEYKGLHLWSNEDSKEKRLVGDLWQTAYSKGIFLMVNETNAASLLNGIS